MSASQPTSELTVRDVLSQVDRRLTLIEGDAREAREHTDAQFESTRREFSEQFAAVRAETAAFRGDTAEQFTSIRAEAAAFRGDTAEQFASIRAETASFRRDTAEQFTGVRSEITALRTEFAQQFAAIRAEANARSRWTVGLILLSWISVMGTNLLR